MYSFCSCCESRTTFEWVSATNYYDVLSLSARKYYKSQLDEEEKCLGINLLLRPCMTLSVISKALRKIRETTMRKRNGEGEEEEGEGRKEIKKMEAVGEA